MTRQFLASLACVLVVAQAAAAQEGPEGPEPYVAAEARFPPG